jgi:hypothetical protein
VTWEHVEVILLESNSIRAVNLIKCEQLHERLQKLFYFNDPEELKSAIESARAASLTASDE